MDRAPTNLHGAIEASIASRRTSANARRESICLLRVTFSVFVLLRLDSREARESRVHPLRGIVISFEIDRPGSRKCPPAVRSLRCADDLSKEKFKRRGEKGLGGFFTTQSCRAPAIATRTRSTSSRRRPRHATPRHAMPCHAMPCQATTRARGATTMTRTTK